MWVRRNRLVTALLSLLVAAIILVIGTQTQSLHRIREARADSEGLIGFMNQDLASDLRDVGRLDLMEKINSRAADYYGRHAALGDGGFLERKARFFENAAEVEKDLGELARAEERAAEAEKIYEGRHQAEPGDPRWRRHQARVRVLRQNIAKEAGLRLAALQHGEAAVRYAAEAMAAAPSDPTNGASLAFALLEQASIWIRQERPDGPATNVARAELLLRDATKHREAEAEWFLWLGNCAYYRARISQLRSDHGRALVEFSEYLGHMQELAARYPRNNRWQYELAIANAQVAAALIHLRRNVQAQPYLDAYENLGRNLTLLDPRNKAWLSLYGKSLALQGDVARGVNGEVALKYLNAALTIQSNLVYQNSTWDQWSENARETTRSLIHLHQDEGRTREARELADEWARQCERRATEQPDHIGHQFRWGDAIVLGARLSRADRPDQVGLLREALGKFVAISPAKPGVLAKARVLSGLAEAFNDAGDPTNAAAYIQEALDIRLGYFKSAPLISRLRDQIPNNFLFTAKYYLRAGDVEHAVSVAEEGLDWASRNLLAEEKRSDYGEMCIRVAEAVDTPELIARAKVLVRRCLSERLTDPSAPSMDDQSPAGRLRNWLDQHP